MRKRDGLKCDEDPEVYKAKAVAMYERFRLWINDPTLYGREKPPSDAKPASQLGEVRLLHCISASFRPPSSLLLFWGWFGVVWVGSSGCSAALRCLEFHGECSNVANASWSWHARHWQVMCLAGLSDEFIDKFPEDRARYMPDVEDAMRRVGIHFDSERGILMEVSALPCP